MIERYLAFGKSVLDIILTWKVSNLYCSTLNYQLGSRYRGVWHYILKSSYCYIFKTHIMSHSVLGILKLVLVIKSLGLNNEFRLMFVGLAY